MIKKILISLFAIAFIATFAACDSDDTTSKASTSSTAGTSSTAATSSTASKAATTESSEAESSQSEISNDFTTGDNEGTVSATVVDGVFKGDGYSFNVPAGFQLVASSNGMNVLMNTNSSAIACSSKKVTSASTEYTQKDFEIEFADYIEDSEVTAFEIVALNDIDVACINYSDSGVQILQYVFLGSTEHYTIAFGIVTDNAIEIATATLATFTIE